MAAGLLIVTLLTAFLKEAVSGLRRVAVLADTNPMTLPRLQAVQDLGKPLRITLTILDVQTDAKLDALAAVAADRPTALVTEPVSIPDAQFRRLADFALQHRLPSMTPYRELTEAGSDELRVQNQPPVPAGGGLGDRDPRLTPRGPASK